MLFVSNWWTIDAKMILGVMEMPLQFIKVYYYFCFYYFLVIFGCWLLQSLEKWKKGNMFNRLQIEVFFLAHISTPNIGPSNFSFVCIYTPGELMGFNSIYLSESTTKSSSLFKYVCSSSLFKYVWPLVTNRH